MFLTSSARPIDSQLEASVHHLEKESPSISVLAAHQFSYSLIQAPIEVTVTTPQPLNILEEFILRAGLELTPSPNGDELATVLGLDGSFIRTTITNLKKLNILKSDPSEPIQLTPQGKAFYEQKPLSKLPEIKQLYVVADPLRKGFLFQSAKALGIASSKNQELPQLEDLMGWKKSFTDFSALSLEEVQEGLSASDLGLHSPEEGKKLNSFQLIGSPQSLSQVVSLFVIFDTLENQIRLELRQGKQILPTASELLNCKQAEGVIQLQDLCQLTDEEIRLQCQEIFDHKNTEVEERIEKIRQQAKPFTKQETEESVTGTAIQLRDREISQAFTEILNSAQYQVILYSPWINQAVVNEDFLTLLQELANRGVWILIGYGIARRQEDEDRPIPLEVKEKLQKIKTSQGFSAVQVCWLGNSHAKEIIVDQKVHLCGSHNWLSYRGDYLPRGESVYQVTIPEQVNEAYQFLARRFRSYAQEKWEQALAEQDVRLAEVAVGILIALEAEELALEYLQNSHWLELLPMWLQAIRQSLKSGQLSPNSPVFEIAFSLLNEVLADDLLVPSLRKSCREVMIAISLRSRKKALKLLNQEDVESNFKRLGIETTNLLQSLS